MKSVPVFTCSDAKGEKLLLVGTAFTYSSLSDESLSRISYPSSYQVSYKIIENVFIGSLNVIFGLRTTVSHISKI